MSSGGCSEVIGLQVDGSSEESQMAALVASGRLFGRELTAALVVSGRLFRRELAAALFNKSNGSGYLETVQVC